MSQNTKKTVKVAKKKKTIPVSNINFDEVIKKVDEVNDRIDRIVEAISKAKSVRGL